MSRNDTLFSRTDWFSVRDQILQAVRDEIDSLDQDRLLGTSVDTLCEYFGDKYTFEVPVLDRSGVEIDHREDSRMVEDYGRTVRIQETVIDVSVPFTGPSDAFGVRPSSYTMNQPRALVASSQLTFSVQTHGRDDTQVRNEIERTLDTIENMLANLRRDASGFEAELARVARERTEWRREKALADKSLVSSLGYKLKERPGAPRTYAPPEVRRKISPRLPPKSAAAFKPEPALGNEDYEHILGVIENMALVMEYSPSAFETLDEEALRSHFLVQLNGHYEGAATGETFNYEGKTDILIRVDGRNIFIAECKFWGGPKKLAETIDQLLGYTSWRDTKTAIILFNRNKNFSKVLEAIPDTVAAHPNYVRSIPAKDETHFRYVLSHRDDPSRELTLTVLAFDVPRADPP